MAASDEWLSVSEAARLLGVSVPTLRRWDRTGKLVPARHPVSTHRVYARSKIDALLGSGSPESREELGFDAIPAPSSSFVGRDAELSALAELMTRGGRLITLFGAGGVGKTRLALELLRRMRDQRSLACCFCDLSGARSSDQVVTAVSAALGAELPTVGALEERERRLVARLSAVAPALLVLDNFEQLVECTGGLVAKWCETVVELRVIVTSRERLRVRGETLVTVGSLAPGPALQLFADRVEAVIGSPPDFDRERELIADLVQRLDGLPLAIELGAARYPLVGARGLSRELGQRLELLGRGARDAPSRHETMRATLDWSWSLLSEDEQRMLRSCSVFVGGFTLGAAEHVADTPNAGELLESLRDKSLLSARAAAGGVRFSLPELCGEYAREHLDAAGEGPAVRRRHAAYYAERARAWVALPAERAVQPPPELVLERSNLLSAHCEAITFDPQGALCLALALERVLAVRDPIDVTIGLIDASLAACARADVDRVLLATALALRGRYLQERGSLESSAEALEQALSLLQGARGSDTRAAEAHLLSLLGLAEIQLGRREAALGHLEGALRVSEAQPEDPGRRYTLAHHASVCHEAGLLERADASYREAMAIASAHGDAVFAARMKARLGRVAIDRGRTDEARKRLSAALHELEGDRYLAFAFVHRGCLARELEQLDRAREDYAHGASLLGELGMLAPSALVRGYLAAVLADLGCSAAAETELARARCDLSSIDAQILGITLGLCAAHVELLSFRRALRAGDEADAGRVLAIVSEQLAAAAAFTERDKDVRFAARMLARTIERCQRDGSHALPCEPALVAAIDGSFFTSPEGERTELEHRPPLRRVLADLVQARIDQPGVLRSTADLVAAGWPGELIQARAAAQRVYSAIAELKALGLEVLRGGAGGYALDASVELRIET